MTHGSLFSGIGGFDLAASRNGIENVFHCEINPFCRKVLKYHFPNSKEHDDITKTNFTVYRGSIDILSGGFPCQDASKAKQNGERQSGLQGAKTGLYWEMLRAITEIQPRFVVAENVADITDINGGYDFFQILKSLWEIGYNVEWRNFYAGSFGAPHLRERCYMVAYSNGIGVQETKPILSNVGKKIHPGNWHIDGADSQDGLPWDDESKIPVVDDGLSPELDGITIPKWRNETIQAAGNAIVPQIAEAIFKQIKSIVNP